MQIGLGQDDGTGFGEFFNRRCRVFGHHAFQGIGAARGGHVLGVHVVLGHDEQTGQGFQRTTGFAIGVNGCRRFHSSRFIQKDERIQTRVFLSLPQQGLQVSRG